MVAAKEEMGAAGLYPPQPPHAGVPYLGSPQSRARERRAQLCSPWAALIIKKLGFFNWEKLVFLLCLLFGQEAP